MRLKTKIMLVAIPVTTIVAAGGAIALAMHFRRLRRKKATSFLTGDVRNALQDLCSLKSEDFISDERKSSLFQGRLETMTDKQLIGIYVALKLVEVLRNRGVDIHQLSKEDVVSELSTLRAATHDSHGRHDPIKQLGSIGAETVHSMLGDAFLIAKMAA
jgi:hypothetical protein